MAWKCYQGFTVKRALFRSFMQLAASIGAKNIFSSRNSNPLITHFFSIDLWLEQVQYELGIENILPVVIWPKNINRGRVYIYLLTNKYKPIGFCKLSFDDLNDTCLLRECHAINQLKNLHQKIFKLPTILVNGNWNGHKYIIASPISMNAWPSYYSYSKSIKKYLACIKEYAGEIRFALPDEVKSFFWWKSLENVSSEDVNTFVSELFDLIRSSSGLPVQRVHGDIGPHNIINTANETMIIDWEESSENGPILTDEIGYFVWINSKSINNRPIRILREFGLRYLHGASSEKVRDVMAALAFRRIVESTDSNIYIRYWNYLKSFQEKKL